MGYYLFDNPPASPQFHRSRNGGGWTGGVLIHTAETPIQPVGNDRAAENVASFIARRRDPGSYHVLGDSDSTIQMLPYTATAFHCAATGYNSTTVGVSYACRTVDLNVDSDWFRLATAGIARTLVAYWREAGYDPTQARFVPATATRTGIGLSTHGEAQPADRSDAWTRHPQRPRLEAAFLSAIMEAAGTVPPSPEDDDVKQVLIRDPRNGTIWHVCGNTRYGLKTMDEVNALRFLGVPMVVDGGQNLVTWISTTKDLGRGRNE